MFFPRNSYKLKKIWFDSNKQNNKLNDFSQIYIDDIFDRCVKVKKQEDINEMHEKQQTIPDWISGHIQEVVLVKR